MKKDEKLDVRDMTKKHAETAIKQIKLGNRSQFWVLGCRIMHGSSSNA